MCPFAINKLSKINLTASNSSQNSCVIETGLFFRKKTATVMGMKFHKP